MPQCVQSQLANSHSCDWEYWAFRSLRTKSKIKHLYDAIWFKCENRYGSAPTECLVHSFSQVRLRLTIEMFAFAIILIWCTERGLFAQRWLPRLSNVEPHGRIENVWRKKLNIYIGIEVWICHRIHLPMQSRASFSHFRDSHMNFVAQGAFNCYECHAISCTILFFSTINVLSLFFPQNLLSTASRWISCSVSKRKYIYSWKTDWHVAAINTKIFFPITLLEWCFGRFDGPDGTSGSSQIDQSTFIHANEFINPPLSIYLFRSSTRLSPTPWLRADCKNKRIFLLVKKHKKAI